MQRVPVRGATNLEGSRCGDDAEARDHEPNAVFVDADNSVKELRAEVVSV